MERVSIQEIAAVLCEKHGLKKKDAEVFASTIFDVVKEGLAVDRIVKIKGLGTFKIIDIEARESINVNTGERVLIEGHERISFTPDASMKELVNRPFSQFETVVLNEGVDFDDTAVGDEESEQEPEVAAEEEDPTTVVEEPEPMPVVEEKAVIPEVIMPMMAETPIEEEPEPEIEEEPEPEAEEKPLPEPEPEVEEEETVPMLEFIEPAEAPEQPAEEPTAETEEPEQTEEPEDDLEEELEEEEPRRPGLVWWLLALAACACSFAGGYYVRGLTGQSEPSEPVALVADSDSVKNAALGNDTLRNDSVTVLAVVDTLALEDEKPADTAVAVKEAVKQEAVKKVEEKPEVKPEVKAEVKPEVKPEVKAEKKAETPAPDKYDQMDSRVRTGAYRIVGLDYTEKVKAGETVQRIARRTLGPDMECYIEVYNGISSKTPLKEGQSLKIPKLELKKKKKKSIN
jgi:nucleoid DNA-binding protein